jgi:glycosyltransferase 2 family protein
LSRKIRSHLVLIITIVFLYLVFRKVGFSNLISTIRGADLYWVLISLIHAPAIILVGVFKWKILLKSQKIEIPLWRLYALYLVGRFFNNFLPSNVGGDLVRGYELGNYAKDGVRAMASVFVERLTGFIVLILMAIFSLLYQLQLRSDLRLTLAVGLATVGLLGVLWLILDPRPLDVFTLGVKIPLFQKYVPKLKKFRHSLNAYRNHQRALALSIFWSVIFMLLAITNVYSSARAFHEEVSLFGVAIIVPVILVVAMIPLTVNGLGIQEWAYVFLFSWIGFPETVGLSTILLIRAKDVLFALLGGILYSVLKISKTEPIPKSGLDVAEEGE